MGGARSGKSRHALRLAESARADTAVVVTAEPRDEEMRARIARHRAERPSHWLTVEEPLDLPGACRRLPGHVELAVVDCLTVWVANRLHGGADETAILSAADDLARLLAAGSRSWLIVSNEVGEGVHPPTSIGLRFRDVLGLVNQRIAAAADRVTLMVAGIPVSVKAPREAAVPAAPAHAHGGAPEAP